MIYSVVGIPLGNRSYDIKIGSRLIASLGEDEMLPSGACAVVVTNTRVDALYGDAVLTAIRRYYAKVFKLVLPDGEEFKDWVHLQKIYDFLLLNHCDRTTVLFALGGGVIGDMTGFAAASYMRGVPFVQIPTTLLAQVDSSVGGKTGINHALGKNMIGAFYQPHLVICDLDVLGTLDDRQVSAGLAEIIKYGPIFDMAFFGWLEEHIDGLRAFEPTLLAQAVSRSCEIKASVVEVDEKESGLRAILNFGHTFGHAIEAGLGYGNWLHGEAVGCGMLMAARLSRSMNLVDIVFVNRLESLLQRAGLPTTAPILDARDNAGRYIELMQLDKKSSGGEIRFVLIDGPGNAVMRAVSDRLVRQVINESCNAPVRLPIRH